MKNNEHYSLAKKYKVDKEGKLEAQYRTDTKGNIIVQDDAPSSTSSKKEYSRLDKFFGNDYEGLRPAQKRQNIICTIAGLLAALLMVVWLIWIVYIVIYGKDTKKEEPTYYIDTEWSNPWEDFVDTENTNQE